MSFDRVLDEIADDVRARVASGMPEGEIREFVLDHWMTFIGPNVQRACEGTDQNPAYWIVDAAAKVAERIDAVLSGKSVFPHRSISYDDAIRLIRETAEHQFINAIDAGVVDPVIELLVIPDDETQVGLAQIRSRDQVAADYDRLSAPAAQLIRSNAMPGDGKMTVVFAAPTGVVVRSEPDPRFI